MADSFRFECSALEAADSRVLALRCDEELGRPYRASVWLAAGPNAPEVDALLGQDAKILIADQPIHGRIFEAELVLATAARRILRLAVLPPLFALAASCHSRVFVDKSVKDILAKILGDNGIENELRLHASYAPRKHVCQYRESDLDFLHRWMEREGIFYYFVQSDGSAKMIVSDALDGHEDVPSGSVRFARERGSSAQGEHLRAFRQVQSSRVEKVAWLDYDYQKPALAIGSPRSSGARGFEELHRFEDNLFDPDEATHAAQVLAEHEVSASARFESSGRVTGLHAGLCFALEEHPRDAFNRKYVCTRVRHEGRELRGDAELARYLGFEGSEIVYEVELEAQPKDVPFRLARRTAWPRAAGLESAIVDSDAASPYAPVDADGRYRVRLFCDEAGSPDGSASAWLRMLQPHAGAPEGYHFPLRKGTEVMIAFVHGDPDRPYIYGAVNTPKTPSPVTSSNHTKNVLQTGSKNRVEIEDQDGSQYIDVSTPPETTFLHLGAHAGLGDHNIVMSTAGDGLHHSGANRDVTVGGKQTEHVKGDLKETYAANQTTHVTGAFEETIDSGMTQTISAGSKVSIDGGFTQTIDGGDTRTVNGGLTETLNGGRTQTINGASTETITGSLTQTVAGGINITTPASYNLTAPAQITFVTGASYKLEGLGGVTILAPGGHMTVDAKVAWLGNQKWWEFLIKTSINVLNITISAYYLRNNTMHFVVGGVKLDLKAVDDKCVTDDKKYGALKMAAKGADAHKKFAQID